MFGGHGAVISRNESPKEVSDGEGGVMGTDGVAHGMLATDVHQLTVARYGHVTSQQQQRLSYHGKDIVGSKTFGMFYISFFRFSFFLYIRF